MAACGYSKKGRSVEFRRNRLTSATAFKHSGGTAEGKAEERTFVAIMQRILQSKEQEVQDPSDTTCRTTAPRSKRRVVVVGDFLLKGTRAAICHLDLGSQEVVLSGWSSSILQTSTLSCLSM